MEPYDPICNQYARDMKYLDAVVESDMRVQYVIDNEYNYNPVTGHFICDYCYISQAIHK